MERESRRRFLQLSVATAVLVVASPLSLSLQGKNELLDDPNFAEDIQKFPNTQFYYHNAASYPNILNLALNGATSNIEIDVQQYGGELFCAHSITELKKMSKKQQEAQGFDKIIQRVIDAGKNPAFDIKPSVRDNSGFKKFNNIVSVLVPTDRLITYSGDPILVNEILESDNVIIVPTFSNDAAEDYFKLAYNWKRKNDNIKRGATVSKDFAASSGILRFNQVNGFETNIYSVNSETQVIQFLDNGATGITSDNRQLLAKTKKAT